MRKALILCLFSFLVSWQVSEWVTDPCPWSLERTIDPYTGKQSPIIVGCLVNHGHWAPGYKMTKTFETREAAEEFVKNAPSCASHFVIEEKP